jgi:hypothetical protein
MPGHAFRPLKFTILKLLKRSNKLSKNPEEYDNENDRKRKIGLAVGARKGDVIEYFETDKNNEGYSLSFRLSMLIHHIVNDVWKYNT